MKIYMLKVSWAVDGNEGESIELYTTKEKALKAFNSEVLSAKQDFDCFDDNGNIVSGWQLEEGVGYWEIYEDGQWGATHCVISVTEKEVIE